MSQTMVYKAPGVHAIHGGHFDHQVVDDEKLDKALADGWHLTTTEAKAAHDEKLKADADAAEEAADAKRLADAKALVDAHGTKGPTRAELEQKADELGLVYNKLLGDKKLAALIDEKLKA
jgi:hypothetical protein